MSSYKKIWCESPGDSFLPLHSVLPCINHILGCYTSQLKKKCGRKARQQIQCITEPLAKFLRPHYAKSSLERIKKFDLVSQTWSSLAQLKIIHFLSPVPEFSFHQLCCLHSQQLENDIAYRSHSDLCHNNNPILPFQFILETQLQAIRNTKARKR